MQLINEIISNNDQNIYPKTTECKNENENKSGEEPTDCGCEPLENHSENSEQDTKYTNERPHLSIQLENKADQLSPANAAEICFQNNRKEIYYNPLGWKVKVQDYVLVETDNGIDIGIITGLGIVPYRKFEIHLKPNNPIIHSIKRKATSKEIERHHQNIENQKKAVEIIRELVEKYNLDMKITGAEWQFDCHRLTIFFIAPQRVDFRELVKEMAKIFKTRIELRQITNREHAKRFCGGVGICGLTICCRGFLNEVKTVITAEHIKTQQLSTSVGKLTGYCGRLKCCLLFEYDYYFKESEKYPKLGSILELDGGVYKLIKFDIFKNSCTFISEDYQRFKNFSLDEIHAFADQHRILEPNEEEKPKPIIEDLDDIDLDKYLGFS
ncbi:hypothetical protein LLG34_02450 [bacterium]|nr:hypothetical protein [bacterium]